MMSARDLSPYVEIKAGAILPPVPDDVPRKTGTCEYCLRAGPVYAFALWICRRCLASGPS